MRENVEPPKESLLVIHGLGWGCVLPRVMLLVKDSVVLTSLTKCLITDVSCLVLKNTPIKVKKTTRITNLSLSLVFTLKIKTRSGTKPPRSATKHARVFVSQNVVYIIADNTKKIHKICGLSHVDSSFR